MSEIISVLNQVSLGHFYFEIALVLRDSMLISKLIYSSEIWYNVSKDQYSKLEEIDEMYFRRIFELPKSTPRIGLYIECGKIPAKYIIKTRRILYLWHILHLDENELLFKFYLAQKLKPGKNDWVPAVFKDLEEIDLKVTEEEIKKMPKEKFRNIVQTKMKISVKKDFLKMQAKPGSGSKTAGLKICEKFQPSKYLFSRNLCPAEIRTLYRLRTRSTSVKGNQKSSFKDNMWC